MYIEELFKELNLLEAAAEESVLNNFKQESDYRRLQEVAEVAEVTEVAEVPEAESSIKMSSLFVVFLERGSLRSADYSKLGFTTKIDSFDETSFTLKLQFSNPKSVSLGSIQDEIILQFTSPNLFVSKESELPFVVSKKKKKIKAGIPPQFEDSADREAVEATKESVETITNIALAVNFLIAIFLTVSLKAMWSLKHMIELIVFLLFVVKWPENTKIVIEALDNATSVSFITEPVFAMLTPHLEIL